MYVDVLRAVPASTHLLRPSAEARTLHVVVEPSPATKQGLLPHHRDVRGRPGWVRSNRSALKTVLCVVRWNPAFTRLAVFRRRAQRFGHSTAEACNDLAYPSPPRGRKASRPSRGRVSAAQPDPCRGRLRSGGGLAARTSVQSWWERAKLSVSPRAPSIQMDWHASAISSSPCTMVANTLPGIQPWSPLISRLFRP